MVLDAAGPGAGRTPHRLLPARGGVTFSVTARGLRLNDDTLRAYAGVLRGLPSARLRLIGAVSLDWPQRADLLARLHAHGVDASRVELTRPATTATGWPGSTGGHVLDSFPAMAG